MYGEVTEHLPCWFLELSLLSNERIRVRCVLTSVFSEVTSVFSESIDVTFVSIVVTCDFSDIISLCSASISFCKVLGSFNSNRRSLDPPPESWVEVSDPLVSPTHVPLVTTSNIAVINTRFPILLNKSALYFRVLMTSLKY